MYFLFHFSVCDFLSFVYYDIRSVYSLLCVYYTFSKSLERLVKSALYFVLFLKINYL